MAIIKKKDLHKYFELLDKPKSKKPFKQKEVEPLDELVDDDGTFIDGDAKNTFSNSEVEVGNTQTTDDFAQSAAQPRNYHNSYGVPYGTGSRLRVENKNNAINILKKFYNG